METAYISFFIFSFFIVPGFTQDEFADHKFTDCGKPLIYPNEKDSPTGELSYLKYPWVVSIFSYNSSDSNDLPKYVCGATIIDINKVITSASCVYSYTKSNSLLVSAGRVYNYWKYAPGLSDQSSLVKTIQMHSSYDPTLPDSEGNIAVLILNKPFKFSSKIMPICFDLDSTSGLPSIAVGLVVGWRKGENGLPREKHVKTLSRKLCKKSIPFSYQSYVLYDSFCTLHKSGLQIETGYEGSGLTFAHNNIYYLNGVVSYVLKDFSVYTDILFYNTWIESILAGFAPNKVNMLDSFSTSYDVEVPDITLLEKYSECGKVFTDKNLVGKPSEGYLMYPWHVAIYRKDTHSKFGFWVNKSSKFFNIKFWCSGTIITSNKILTAGECVYGDKTGLVDSKDIFVVVGKYHSRWQVQDQYQQNFQVKTIIVNNFKGSALKYQNNIAVLILDKEISFTERVMPVCLDLESKSLTEQQGLVVGWGSTTGALELESELKEKWVNYVDSKTCLIYKSPLYYERFVHYDSFCATFTNGSTIQKEDGGSGITFVRNNKHYMYGITGVSQFNRNNNLATFTNVTAFAPWLNKILL